MYIPIGLLISLVLGAFVLGSAIVPLFIFVVIKRPARMKPKASPVKSRS